MKGCLFRLASERRYRLGYRWRAGGARVESVLDVGGSNGVKHLACVCGRACGYDEEIGVD
jgi:hypothetical protein